MTWRVYMATPLKFSATIVEHRVCRRFNVSGVTEHTYFRSRNWHEYLKLHCKYCLFCQQKKGKGLEFSIGLGVAVPTK